MTRRSRRGGVLAAAVLTAGLLAGCGSAAHDAKTIGDKTSQGAKDAGDAASNGAKDTGIAIKDGGEKAGDAVGGK